MGKHAYLIMCHNNLEVLKTLVSLLDDSRNDIYIHIDRKARLEAQIKNGISIKNASVIYVDRVPVNWAGFSQIRAELSLLKCAVKKKYDYYHLVSGADLPIKTQDEIHQFFDSNNGLEFIGIDNLSAETYEYQERIRYYRFFQDFIGRSEDRLSCFLRSVEQVLLKFQKWVGVDRTRKISCKIYKGSQWFSITHGMVEFILSKEKDIFSIFQYGLGVDELFVQTIAMNSPYRQNIANDSLRYIDWERGSPYTFTAEDYSLLLNSDKLFARKFDEKKDFQIVARIRERIETNYDSENN